MTQKQAIVTLKKIGRVSTVNQKVWGTLVAFTPNSKDTTVFLYLIDTGTEDGVRVLKDYTLGDMAK